jgi:hypothetical protein
MRPFILFLLLGLCSCYGSEGRQNIDLSDAVIERPVDGIGHYVYALSLPEKVGAGRPMDIQMEWRTAGSVDPNARYVMDVRFSGPATKDYSIASSANTVGELHLNNWLSHRFQVPTNFPPGIYTVGVRLRDEKKSMATVPVGYKPDRKMEDGFWRLAEFEVMETQR